MQTILVVDDEPDILEFIEYILTKNKYNVISLKDTQKMEQILSEEDVSLILMDRNLPKCEGSLYIEKLRNKGYNVPVIYVSAKDNNKDILKGFDRGGDDYITKPFNPDELVARVKAVIKRYKKDSDILKCKDIVFDKINSKVFIANKEIKLSKLDKKLLYEFMKNSGILLDRGILLQNVWEDSFEKQLKTVNVAIKRLKEKIDPNGEKEYIKAIRGEGYIFC